MMEWKNFTYIVECIIIADAEYVKDGGKKRGWQPITIEVVNANNQGAAEEQSLRTIRKEVLPKLPKHTKNCDGVIHYDVAIRQTTLIESLICRINCFPFAESEERDFFAIIPPRTKNESPSAI